MRILAIETSCDETGISIVETENTLIGEPFREVKVLANTLLSQASLHAEYGGVFPSMARREHAKNIIPLLVRALSDAGLAHLLSSPRVLTQEEEGDLALILKKEPVLFVLIQSNILALERPDVDAIAVTAGPGLEPALWVGINTAQALSALWNIPIIPINHMEGHIVAALLRAIPQITPPSQSHIPATFRFSSIKNHSPYPDTAHHFLNQKNEILQKSETESGEVIYGIALSEKLKVKSEKLGNEELAPKIYHLNPLQYPALALLISGGHTELVLIRGIGDYEILGQTLDDAVGEAFDKVARMLGLPYPGGPEISKLAETAPVTKMPPYPLPRPMLKADNFNFSFAGLKTAVLYTLRNIINPTQEDKAFIAKEFENSVTEILITKTRNAAKEIDAKEIILGGGVTANKKIREAFTTMVSRELPDTKLFIPTRDLSTDNALMIAIAGLFRFSETKKDIVAEGHLRLAKSNKPTLAELRRRK